MKKLMRVFVMTVLALPFMLLVSVVYVSDCL